MPFLRLIVLKKSENKRIVLSTQCILHFRLKNVALKVYYMSSIYSAILIILLDKRLDKI